MQKLISLHASGVLKQGDVIVGIDYPGATASVWTFAICKLAGLLVLFAKHTSSANFQVCDVDLLSNFKRDNQGSPDVLNILDAVTPYSVTVSTGAGKVYVADATETGLYFDGVNKITTAPATIKTTADILKDALGGSGGATGGSQDNTDVVPFWKKPINIGLAVLGAIVAVVLYKKYA